MTNETRAVRHIESAVRERTNGAHDLQDHGLGFAKVRAGAWREELVCEVLLLNIADVGRSHSYQPHLRFLNCLRKT